MILFAFFFILMFLRVPIAVSLGVSSIIYILLKGGQIPLMVAAQRMIVSLDSFPFLAVPLFILAGELMNAGGVTHRLVKFANALVGRFTGGLAHVVIVTNMIMAGMSGSAVADLAGTGTVLIPAMTKAKFPIGFSSAVVAAASTIGPIIPPSIPLVVYGVISSTPIDKLFLGGFLPGVLMGIYLMIASYFISKRRSFEKGEKFPFIEIVKTGLSSFGALIMPFLIIGGMLFGAVTPTETAGVAVGYALFLGFFIYRELKLKDLPTLMINSIKTSAVVFFVVATSALFGWLLIRDGFPFYLQQVVASYSMSPLVFMIAVNIMVLILGCFIEVMAILIILVPVLLPTLHTLNIDLVYFGVVFVLNLMVGFLTPPFGMGMFMVCALSKISIETYTKESYIFIIVLIGALFTITVFPKIIMFLPNLF